MVMPLPIKLLRPKLMRPMRPIKPMRLKRLIRMMWPRTRPKRLTRPMKHKAIESRTEQLRKLGKV
jgi:hypothetical protein